MTGPPTDPPIPPGERPRPRGQRPETMIDVGRVVPDGAGGFTVAEQIVPVVEGKHELATGRAAADDAARRRAILTKAVAAFTNNREFLEIPSPTAAQNVAQVQRLTRQVNGILRIVLDVYDGEE